MRPCFAAVCSEILSLHAKSAGVEECIDLCGLPPPEPMERILDWLDGAAPGEQRAFLLPHVPYPLFEQLARLRCRWQTERHGDGRALVRITRLGIDDQR